MKLNILRQIAIMSRYLLMSFLLQCLFYTLLNATPGKAQRISIEEVSIRLKTSEYTLKQFFKEVNRQSGFNVSYDHTFVNDNERVILEKKENSLGEFLRDIAKQQKLSFRRVNETIFVKDIPLNEEIALVEEVFPEQTKISGIVTSSDDSEPLPGVSILIKGTSTGTTTDFEGKYSLSTSNDAVLVFNYVGYKTQEIEVGNQTQINVQLEVDIEQLEEVIVVGYGTQTKSDVTGSIISVQSEDIKDMVVTSADALLQGKAAGVQVVQNSGSPGGEVFVRVRGTASLRGDSRPLYVIDGVPMNNTPNNRLEAGGQPLSPLADINPNDIESMEILKDAAATAIYGARGSNGVVLITTKRGSEGKATINFNASYGVQEVWRKLDFLDGQGYLDVTREARTNRGLSNDVTPYDRLELTGINTDWQDEIFRTAPISSYNVSASGGSDRVQTFVSLGYFNQEGTIIGQDYTRISGRLNMDYKASDKLTFGLSSTYSDSKNDRVANDFSGISVMGNALLRNPNLPVRNEDGTYSQDPLGRDGTENPVLLANEITNDQKQRRLIANIYAEYELLEGLNIRSTFGFDFLSERINLFEPSFVLRRQGIAQANASFIDDFTWVNDNTITYTKEINNIHNISVLGGLGIQRNRNTRLQAGGQSAGSDIITTISIANPGIPQNVISEWVLLSYFGRANYSFRDKYLIEASFRVDGSSRFGEDNQYGFFPGVSLGWRIVEEAFMQDIDMISDMKLRFGVGQTGNQDGIGNFSALTLYGGNNNYDGRPGLAQTQTPNPNLSWESTITTNLGVDIGLFNNRLNISADAYIKETNDLIFQRLLPFTSGFQRIQNVNVGSMENRGIELAISTVNMDGDFKWSTDFNISFNRNEITDLPENGDQGSDLIFDLPDAYDAEGPFSIYREGEPVGSFFGYRYLGVYASNDDVPENLRDDENNVNNNYQAGYPIFEDVNGDGQYDRSFDRVLIGNALPLHTGGITNTFSYKNIELSVFMNWSYGNDVYNMTNAVLTGMTGNFNQSVEVLNRWRASGDQVNIPVALFGASSVQGASVTDASSRYIEDGSFLRVRNVTLSYNLPSQLLDWANVSAARIYFTGQNLYTFTGYSGFDPESQNTGGRTTQQSIGVDYLTQPQPRVYMFGVNLKL